MRIGTAPSKNEPLHIGKGAVGVIDEMRLYDRAITANENKFLFWNPGGGPGRTEISGNQVTTGLIKSKNYAKGSTGSVFNLETGQLETQNGIFRGHIEATSGSFSGDLTGATGTFSGELAVAGGYFSGEFGGDLSEATGTLSNVGGTFNGALNGANFAFILDQSLTQTTTWAGTAYDVWNTIYTFPSVPTSIGVGGLTVSFQTSNGVSVSRSPGGPYTPDGTTYYIEDDSRVWASLAVPRTIGYNWAYFGMRCTAAGALQIVCYSFVGKQSADPNTYRDLSNFNISGVVVWN